MYRLIESPFGLMLCAIRDNPQKARFLGANAYRTRLLAFVVSAMFGGAGGALLGVSTGFADPELAYWTHSGDLVFMIVLGGFGHFFGPIAGATAFILLRDWLMSMTEYWRFLLGGLLAVTVVVAPSGLIGIAAMLRVEAADGSTT
jgi:branched-chain amino acid transport system permease protein